MPTPSTRTHRRSWAGGGLALALGLQFWGPAMALATGPLSAEQPSLRTSAPSQLAKPPAIDPARMQPDTPAVSGAGPRQQRQAQALKQLRAQADDTAPRKGPPAARQAAQRDAAWLLGLLSLHGTGTAHDPAAARQWFARAQALGHPLAAAGLAWCAIDGCGGPPQPGAAAPWIAQLRRSDPARADYLDWLRGQQLAPLQDTDRAAPARMAANRLLARAAAGGNPAAQVEYGLALLENGQREAALLQFRQAAARSPAAAANAEWLQMTSASKPADRNVEQSAQWLAEAKRYHRGEGVPANYTEALRLYQRAANAGNAEARRMLQTIYSRPGPVGGIDIPWMQQLARLNLDALGQAVPGTLASVHAFARDPTPLYDLVPAQWR